MHKLQICKYDEIKNQGENENKHNPLLEKRSKGFLCSKYVNVMGEYNAFCFNLDALPEVC